MFGGFGEILRSGVDAIDPMADRRKKKILQDMVMEGARGPADGAPGEGVPSGMISDAPAGIRKVMGGTPPSPTMVPQNPIPEANKGSIIKGPVASRATAAEMEALKNSKPVEEKGFWKRIGSGINKGFRTWGEAGREGGIGGLLGAIATGGITGAASPKAMANWQKERSMGQLQRRYAGEVEQETKDAKMGEAMMKGVSAEMDARTSTVEQVIKNMRERGYAEEGEVDFVRSHGINMTDPNNGRFVTEERNGKSYTRRINEPESHYDPSLPTELGDQYFETTAPGTNQKVPAKPSQVLSTSVGVAQANAGRVQRAEEFNERQESDNEKTMAKYSQDQAEARAKKARAQTALAELQSSRLRLIEEGESPETVDNRIALLKGDIAAADVLLKQQAPKTKTSGKQTYTEAAAREFFKNKGRDEAYIQRKIAEGRAQGIIR